MKIVKIDRFPLFESSNLFLRVAPLPDCVRIIQIAKPASHTNIFRKVEIQKENTL